MIDVEIESHAYQLSLPSPELFTDRARAVKADIFPEG